MVIKMKEFFQNIGIEFKKITWPTDKEMKLYTTQVFVFMLIMTLFFAVVDGVISVGMAGATGTEDAYEAEYDYDNYDLDDLLDDDYEEENGEED
jgi:preprotein translocase subunit SecE